MKSSRYSSLPMSRYTVLQTPLTTKFPYEIQLITNEFKIAVACNMIFLVAWKGYFRDVVISY